MTNSMVTYEQLDQVLRQLGFIARKVEPRWQRYEHARSGTLIILGDQRPNESVLPSEFVSARRHLIEKGHVDSEELEQMFSSKSPRQESTSSSRTEK